MSDTNPADNTDLSPFVEKGLYAFAVALSAVLLLSARSAPSASPRLDQDRPARDTAGRGREAVTPSQIPARGWKDILVRVYRGISEDRVFALAAGSTYYVLLAIFPATAALVAIYGLFSNPSDIGHQLSALNGFLPGGAMDVLGEELKRLSSQSNGTLSFALIGGLVIALWSANSGVKALFDSLNQVYGETETRSFIRLNLLTLAFTLSAIVLLALSLAAIVVLPVIFNDAGISSAAAVAIQVGRWPLLFIVLSLVLALVYRFGPDRRQPQWRWVTWGSAAAAILWIIASILFSWYAANFGSFNKTYGSLGAIIGFMIWIWISMIVVLLGAELDAEMEHQTVRDTTSGAPRPMGQRQAHMADTVGAAQG